jgi:periplasmic protein TonB
VIHVIILSILWFIVLTEPDPPLTDSGGGPGMAISLGEPDLGGPSEAPVAEMEDPTPTPPQQQTETPVVVDETETEPDAVVTQPKERPKAEPKKEPVKKPDVPKPVQPKVKPREADTRALMGKRTTTADNGSGYGTGDEPGNQGDQNGSPDGRNNGTGGTGDGGRGGGIGNGDGPGIGSGTKDGIGWVLKDRTLQRPPSIEDKSKETGKQVISIVVNRNGKVIKAMPNQRGSTNPKLAEIARLAAMDMKFSPKPDAPDEQYGTVTIEFKFKP